MKFKARKLVNVNDISIEEWLKLRKKGIGGSEAGVIAGLGNPKYNSRLSIYQDKLSNIVDIEPPSEAAEMGHIMEPVIREVFKQKNPQYKVYRSNFMWQSIEAPFVISNVDGLIYCPEKGWGVLEIKNMSEYRLKEFGEEEIPTLFQIQMHHYLYCLGLDWGVFAVFIGGNKYREFFIKRNEDLIKSLIKIERHFWENHVLKRIPPEPDGSEASNKVLQEIYTLTDAKKKDEVLTLSRDVQSLTEAYEFYKAEEKKMATKKEKAKQDLQALLGKYQTAQIEGDTKKIHWTFKKAFDVAKLQDVQPDLYKKYVKPTFDSKTFQKAYPKVYEECKVETNSRTFSYQ